MIHRDDSALLLVAATGLAVYAAWQLVGWVRWQVGIRRNARLRARGFEVTVNEERPSR